jgi:hypothetical protein
MDAEESFALLEITPQISPVGKTYRCQESITIRPYPNPATFGGMYGTSWASTEEELEAIIAGFNSQADRFRENGMTRVEVKRNEPEVVTAQCRLEPSPQVEEEEEEENQPMQASFI